MEDLFKALGEEGRLRILNLLMQRELCVCEIEYALKISQSNASRSLAKLKAVGIVRSKKFAQWVIYYIDEKFKEENQELLKYLKLQFSSIKLYKDDINHLNRIKLDDEFCRVIPHEKH